MKKLMNIYESCKTPIRVTYFGFFLLAFGFLIKSNSFNVFYTFRSTTILFLAEFASKVGEFIIMNLPLIFMMYIVCKKANNSSPIVMALVGYFTFIVTTMLLANQNLNAQAYSSGYGINSVFNISGSTRLPLETGMIGSILVALITRFSFIFSRHRRDFSITNIFSKEITGIIYNFVLCFILGVFISYTYPYLYQNIQRAISFISADLSDPFRIGLYSVLDRVLCILGLGNVIRYPFWFTATGGSLSNVVTGQNILGDINIWKYIQESSATYLGAGRFISPYYVINMFIVPGIYLGTLLSMSDKKDRRYLIFTFVCGIILSFIAGNPLPLELLMLFTSPALLIMYLILVGVVSGTLVNLDAYLGFVTSNTNTIVAMPGSFVDFVINLRNSSLSHSLQTIFLVGLASFAAMFIITMFYYRYLAFDFVQTGSGAEFVDKLVEAVGGIENISDAGSGLFKLNIYLSETEKISLEKMQELGIRRIVETRNGLAFDVGTSANAISRDIRKRIKVAAAK